MTRELYNKVCEIRWLIVDEKAKKCNLTKQQTEDAHSMVEAIYGSRDGHIDWEFITDIVCQWLEELGDYEVKEGDVDKVADIVDFER